MGIIYIFISYCTNFILCSCNYNDSFPGGTQSRWNSPEAFVEKYLSIVPE